MRLGNSNIYTIPLGDLLRRLQDLPIEQQKHRFVQEIDEWRRNQKQIDDTLLFGIQITE